MAKTLNELAAEVLDEIGEDSTDTDLLAQAGKWIQRIFDEVGDEMDWRFNYILETVATVASTRTYDLDIDIRDITSARIQTSGEVLEYRSKDFLVSNGYNMETEGTPVFFYHDEFNTTNQKGKVGLFPIPNAVKTIEFHCAGRPTTLSASVAIPVPNEFLGLLHEGALALAHRHEREWESFDRTYQMYQAHKEKLKRMYSHPRAAKHVLQPTDIPTKGNVNPSRLPPGRFRNWW